MGREGWGLHKEGRLYILYYIFVFLSVIHIDTMAFFKRYNKYGMSNGTATEPVWTPQTRTEYARRMHVVRTALSIAIARTTGNTLLHGANTLPVTGHTF